MIFHDKQLNMLRNYFEHSNSELEKLPKQFFLLIDAENLKLNICKWKIWQIYFILACFFFGNSLHFRKVIKKAWDKTKTVRTNIQEMGLAFDPNETIPIRQPAVNFPLIHFPSSKTTFKIIYSEKVV